jgi:predicted transglutaminase-like cysteine proteinase
MPDYALVRATARLVVAIALAGFGAEAAIAQAGAPDRIALMTPGIAAAPARAGEPFAAAALLSNSQEAALSAKWAALQPALEAEAQMLQACRNDRQLCSVAASRFLAAIDDAGDSNGRARVGRINRAVNLAIRPVSDLAQFQVPDVWTTPLMTFASGQGDCEDYAIAKYVALREAGLDAADLRIVIVHDERLDRDHAVTAARVDGQWLILDNRRMILLDDRQTGDMTPLLSLGVPASAALATAT